MGLDGERKELMMKNLERRFLKAQSEAFRLKRAIDPTGEGNVPEHLLSLEKHRVDLDTELLPGMKWMRKNAIGYVEARLELLWAVFYYLDSPVYRGKKACESGSSL
jgi:hypothetical protein